ncbi:3'-5' exoribonuclease yhaM, partial [Lacticaseibacillus paracasei subsp. paracasei CNCM I-4649]
VNHHAFAGGLAFHTLSILRLAKSVVQQYSSLNKSLLYAGAILHDLGKTIELSGPISTDYTVEGNLIGHIVLIDEQIVLAAQQLKIDINAEDMLLLRHVVLAHHGLLEYGSPVRPELLEAQVLHDLDELDASINMMTPPTNMLILVPSQNDFSVWTIVASIDLKMVKLFRIRTRRIQSV